MVTAVKLHPTLEKYLREAAEQGASDLFLLPDEPLTLRINGQIRRTAGEPLRAADIAEIAAAAVGKENLAAIGRDVSEIHRSCALPAEFNGRISVASAYGQYTIAVQLAAPQIASVEEIRVPRPILDAVLGLKGLVVFSGLAGSGKSTTAYSVLDYVNANAACHICTVEEPIYVRLTPKKAIVQQREVGSDVTDPVAGIRAAVVQDCDVIFLLEVKSLEQLEACISAAETGHLVITVFHSAATPQELIQRIVEAFPDDNRNSIRLALSKNLKVVCTQTLLPGKDKGRFAAYSYVIPDREMQASIAEGKDLPRTSTTRASCVTMQQAIEQLLAEGLVNEQSARQALNEL